MRIKYELLPKHIRGGAKRWIEEGIHPGGFLEQAFRNSLTGAFGTADEKNRAAMWSIAEFMYNEAPELCRMGGFDEWKGLKNMGKG